MALNYLTALEIAHRILQPSSYYELGCRTGAGLALSKTASVGIDPNLRIEHPLTAPTRLFKATADEFFALDDIDTLIPEPIDLAFISSVQPLDAALRNVMNLERCATRSAAIAIADVSLPGAEEEDDGKNDARTEGNLNRLVSILRYHRPDLDIRVYDIGETGFVLVSGLDPSSTILKDAYAPIERQIAEGTAPSTPSAALCVLPAERLAADLGELATRRGAEPSSTPASPVALYLELLKKSVLNEIYLDDELRLIYLRRCLDGKEKFRASVMHNIRFTRADEYLNLAVSRHWGQFMDGDIRNAGFAHSMMGRVRVDNLQVALDLIRAENIPGDMIECGVWRGGGCIFMAGYLLAHNMSGRRVFVADSFEGLPVPTHASDGELDLSKAKFPELAVSLDAVQGNFSVYGLEQPNVVFLKGWFKDTLPTAPVERIALLRLDGDLYESTMDILLALYDRVVPGGVVIVDDYNYIAACKQAVADFFETRNLPLPEMIEIDWAGSWFRKP
jgi:O-methyltransferase